MVNSVSSVLLHCIVLPAHIPHLLKSLEPVWAQWEMFGLALNIPQSKLNIIKSNHQLSLPSCQDNQILLSVLKLFAKTPFEEHTWRNIHEAVKMLDKMTIAQEIEEKYENLDEPCKAQWSKLYYYIVFYSAT